VQTSAHRCLKYLEGDELQRVRRDDGRDGSLTPNLATFHQSSVAMASRLNHRATAASSTPNGVMQRARRPSKAAHILTRRLRGGMTNLRQASDGTPPGRPDREALVDERPERFGGHRHQRQRKETPELPRDATCRAVPPRCKKRHPCPRTSRKRRCRTPSTNCLNQPIATCPLSAPVAASVASICSISPGGTLVVPLVSSFGVPFPHGCRAAGS